MGKYTQRIPEIREKIVKEFQPEKIILFGSYAWGTPTDDSDVDLFIIKKSDKRRIDRVREVGEIIFDSGIPVDALVYTPEEIKRRFEIEDPFIEHIFKRGKVLFQA